MAFALKSRAEIHDPIEDARIPEYGAPHTVSPHCTERSRKPKNYCRVLFVKIHENFPDCQRRLRGTYQTGPQVTKNL